MTYQNLTFSVIGSLIFSIEFRDLVTLQAHGRKILHCRPDILDINPLIIINLQNTKFLKDSTLQFKWKFAFSLFPFFTIPTSNFYQKHNKRQ